MSKSIGNYIGISEPPEVIYGKTMSIPDEAMINYCNLVTRWSPQQIAEIKRDVNSEIYILWMRRSSSPGKSWISSTVQTPPKRPRPLRARPSTTRTA
jgi:hypothetical protein